MCHTAGRGCTPSAVEQPLSTAAGTPTRPLPPIIAAIAAQLFETDIDRCKEEEGLLCNEWSFGADETELYAHEWYKDAGAVAAHIKMGGETLQRLLQAAPPTKVDIYGEVADELEPSKPMIAGYWGGFSKS